MKTRLLGTAILLGLLSGYVPGPLLSVTAQAADTSRALIVGDSIMQMVARSLERELGRKPGVTAASYTSIGTGLARMDLFDWHRQLQTLMNDRQPGVVIIMMGANDNQPMRTKDGVVQSGTPEWETEYAKRAGEAMDIMIRAGAHQVHWIELPDMRDPRLQTDARTINRILQSEAQKRPQVTFQPSRPLLSRTVGEFSPYIIQANGMPLDIRARDGIHLNRAGADLLARHIIARIWSE